VCLIVIKPRRAKDLGGRNNCRDTEAGLWTRQHPVPAIDASKSRATARIAKLIDRAVHRFPPPISPGFVNHPSPPGRPSRCCRPRRIPPRPRGARRLGARQPNGRARFAGRRLRALMDRPSPFQEERRLQGRPGCWPPPIASTRFELPVEEQTIRFAKSMPPGQCPGGTSRVFVVNRSGQHCVVAYYGLVPLAKHSLRRRLRLRLSKKGAGRYPSRCPVRLSPGV